MSASAPELVARHDAVIWDRVDGVMSLCHTGTVAYFRLDEVGAQIWCLCDGRSVDDIIAAMCAQYPDSSHDEVAAEVQRYLSMLAQAGLLASPAAA